MARILIYGTDESVTRRLSQVLQKESFDVQSCDAFGKMPAPLAEPTLVVLDARLKWSVCRPLFNEIQTVGYPVLFLTRRQGNDDPPAGAVPWPVGCIDVALRAKNGGLPRHLRCWGILSRCVS